MVLRFGWTAAVTLRNKGSLICRAPLLTYNIHNEEFFHIYYDHFGRSHR